MSRAPWFCPSCQKHHGPHVDTCPQVTPANPLDNPWRVIPQDYRDLFLDQCAGCKGACGNVACPRRVYITCHGSNTYGAAQ